MQSKVDNSGALKAGTGKLQVVAETVTDNRGNYNFQGNIPLGQDTIIEVLSISRPGNGLPTTYVIANKDAQSCDTDAPSCFKKGKSKFSKDDRLVYAFRKTITTGISLVDEDESGVSHLGMQDRYYESHNRFYNPIVNFVLDDESEATIIDESYHKVRHSAIKNATLNVGTTVFDILNFIAYEAIPNCTNKTSTIIDLHYYPDMSEIDMDDLCQDPEEISYEEEEDSSADKLSKVTPTKLEQYGKSNHYHALLPPKMHLKVCLGDCYPFQLKKTFT